MSNIVKIIIVLLLIAAAASTIFTLIVVKFDWFDLQISNAAFWFETFKTICVFFILGFMLEALLKIANKKESE